MYNVQLDSNKNQGVLGSYLELNTQPNPYISRDSFLNMCYVVDLLNAILYSKVVNIAKTVVGASLCVSVSEVGRSRAANITHRLFWQKHRLEACLRRGRHDKQMPRDGLILLDWGRLMLS